ncbi:MAG: hypothetical protein HKN23_12090 [Verrucomicrobiales bacterium]|nr:hypothetical protein [Verrucomicrobiales bacterium]
MKKFVVALTLVGMVVTSATMYADIQAPPKSKQTSTNKLARGLSNILYGFTELPTSVIRSAEVGDPVGEVWFGGVIRGFERTGQRLMYGVYEVVNWRKPLFKDTYRAPYDSLYYDPVHGYEEFPPQIGTLSTLSYCRNITW